MKPRPDPELLDDDAPEADAGWFAGAKPAPELLPELFGPVVAAEMLSSDRGHAGQASGKERITVVLDVEVVEAFRSTGRGWQSRLNSALRDWLQQRTPSSTG